MKKTILLVSSCMAAFVLAAIPAGGGVPNQPANKLVLHEWGTFLAMQGSDGITLDGMYHEEHALPAFVHSRSRDQLKLPTVLLKGETPVIYFYTDQPQDVSVTVDFPKGIWTQWYPQASFARPTLAASGAPPTLRNGRIGWNVRLVPAKDMKPANTARQVPAPPATSPGALWNFARDVDAAYVAKQISGARQPKTEWERFLFYRGLGQAPLPLEMTPQESGTLTASQTLTSELRHVFVVRIEKGQGAYAYFPALRPGETKSGVLASLGRDLPLKKFVAKISDELAARLVDCGLYPKEARAMVNTWRSSYFQTDGLRVLFVLPERWTDEFIPMTVWPKPNERVRVMVGRLEVLTPERERQAEQAVRDLGSDDAKVRESAFAYLRKQGRYVEPIVRRVSRTTQDPRVRALCARLLLTDFVTELRSSVSSPVTGQRLYEEPVFVQARLASLLREIGLEKEAKAEAARVLRALQKMIPPPTTDDSARHYLRAFARTVEGQGDEQAATESYGKFVSFASQARTRREYCIACHQGSEGPRSMAWFQHWWVGERFGRHALGTGRIDGLIAEQEKLVQADAQTPSANLMLAYLYAAKGDRSGANKAWERLGVPPTTTAPAVAESKPKTD